MNSLRFDMANLLCGLLLIATGIFFALESLDLELGTALRMGPGYFPFILACALILFGAIILVQAFRAEGEPIGPIAIRGMLFILPAPIIFGLILRGMGFVPSIFLTALFASFASQRMTPLYAVLLSAGLTIFSLLVFVYGLNLPFRAFGPWLGF
ncbi:tripartite tricarboxylate transporter TctB family protein [Rhizobium sp. NTR19]|uniref:Tripartite tricarboxylate transporter TctB family protein n=1 Tax=Neorhizobium turbinariae TaxID=2937795 RepID=A0ABT0ILW1_9HYPH|nr:tripartite tricarboxylate transporter TctB family protein [Neorhizobium turbinariae]MCK8778862.1 tripartite tricarboxylate transporter TctB family protein [Neorhizobium turbinariae]